MGERNVLTMEFNDKVVVVTGGAQGIGKCCAECFRQEGAMVHVIDIQQGPWFVGDLADKSVLCHRREHLYRHAPAAKPSGSPTSNARSFARQSRKRVRGMTRNMIYHDDNGWRLEAK